MRVRNVRVRFNRDEGVEMKRTDLARSPDANVAQMATADRDRDGWVTSDELQATQGLNASTYFDHMAMTNEARKARFGASSVVGLRARLAQGEHIDSMRPDPLGPPDADLTALSRKAFVPLAEHLAARLAAGESYESYYGTGDDRIFHADVTDVYKGRSAHEMYAALAIMAAREGGMEFALTRDDNGRVHVVQGVPDRVELDSDITGLDLLIHTHPRTGADGARPSAGDLYSAQEFDPDKVGRVVSEDGWFAEYGGAVPSFASPPRRLWTPDDEG